MDDSTLLLTAILAEKVFICDCISSNAGSLRSSSTLSPGPMPVNPFQNKAFSLKHAL